MNFGERLKEERVRLGCSQEAMGAIGGVRKLAQHNYEKGERAPDSTYLAAIAAAGADVLYILTGERTANAAQGLRADEQLLLEVYDALSIDGDENISFPPEVIAATPRQVQIDRDEKVEHLRDVDLQIRATDLDSTDRGWAALIPGKIDRRVRLMLDPNVRPAEVADKFQLRADVSVYYKLDGRSNRLAPDHIVLHQVIE